MAAIANVARSSLTPTLVVRESVISYQIEKINRKIQEVLNQLRAPTSALTHDETKRMRNDARDMLVHCRSDLRQLMKLSKDRDSECMFFDDDRGELTVDIQIDQDPTESEIERCRALLKQIEDCGVDLSKARAVKNYLVLSYETNRIFERIRIIRNQIEACAPTLLNLDSRRRAISALELQGLKVLAKELQHHALHLSNLTHRTREINCFAEEGVRRFARAKIRANRIALKTAETILVIEDLQLSKIRQMTVVPSFLPTRLREVLEITGEIQRLIKANQAADTSVVRGGAAAGASLEQGPGISQPVSDRGDVGVMRGVASYDLEEVSDAVHSTGEFSDPTLPPEGLNPTLKESCQRLGASTLLAKQTSAPTKELAVFSLIQMMKIKIDQVRTELRASTTLEVHKIQKIKNDARSFLSFYDYVVKQLIGPDALSDADLIYFDEDYADISIDKPLSAQEIRECQYLLMSIKSCELDLANAQEFRSYQHLAYDADFAYQRIRTIADEFEGSIKEFLSSRGEYRKLSSLELWGLKSITREINYYMRGLSEIVDFHKREEVNSFTFEGQHRFIEAALAANSIGIDIVQAIADLTSQQLTKAEDSGMTESSSLCRILKKIDLITGEILHQIRKNQIVFNPRRRRAGVTSSTVENSTGGSIAALCGRDSIEVFSIPAAGQALPVEEIATPSDMPLQGLPNPKATRPAAQNERIVISGELPGGWILDISSSRPGMNSKHGAAIHASLMSYMHQKISAHHRSS